MGNIVSTNLEKDGKKMSLSLAAGQGAQKQ